MCQNLHRWFLNSECSGKFLNYEKFYANEIKCISKSSLEIFYSDLKTGSDMSFYHLILIDRNLKFKVISFKKFFVKVYRSLQLRNDM